MVLAVLAAPAALGQALPRITALYPPGARAGSTVEVAIRAGGLEGARQLVVEGAGITAELNQAAVKIDPAEQKVFETKCMLCHQLRSPATVSRTPEQWAQTVDRMIRGKGAPIDAGERTKIVNYLQASARAAAGLTATVKIAPDALLGKHDLRVVGSNGTSTAFPFEVSADNEVLEIEPNDSPEKAQPVTLPVTVSGQIGPGDVDCFAFQAKKGERVVFNCRAFRLNPASQGFFFPVLTLCDVKGKELARNSGYYDLDPLIDWTATADGRYVVMVRDMLYRGSPSSVYRLTMGAVPYDTLIFPAGGQRGAVTAATVTGQNMLPQRVEIPIAADSWSGVREIGTRYGSFRFMVGDFPEVLRTPIGIAQPVRVPATLNGRLQAAEQGDRYSFPVSKATAGRYVFAFFSKRFGSPAVGRLTLFNQKGLRVADSPGNPGDPEPRLEVNLTEPGLYELLITDPTGGYGPRNIYRVSAGPFMPELQFSISPDNPNLGPGSSVYLRVNIQRRVGIPGDITISFPQLPPGVTASRCVIRPNEGQGFIILTAAPDARPGSFVVTDAVARTTVDHLDYGWSARPEEVYRVGNNNLLTERSSMVVTVGPPPPWSVTLEPAGSAVGPRGGPLNVTVRVQRKNFDGDIPFMAVGLPPGLQAQQNFLVRQGTSEFTLTLTPTEGGVFAHPAPGQQGPASFLLSVVSGREGEGMQMCSPAVPILVTTL